MSARSSGLRCTRFSFSISSSAACHCSGVYVDGAYSEWQAVHFARYIRRASDMGPRGGDPPHAAAHTSNAAAARLTG